MSTDTRLRELERRWQESGSRADEAAYQRELIRTGSNGHSFSQDDPFVLFHRLVDAGLNIEDAEKLFCSPSLAQRLLEVIRQHEEPLPEDYADEEVESDFDYPEGFRFRTPTEQLEVWRQHFPDLDATHVDDLLNRHLPQGAESWAVIPKPSRLGGYHQALEMMLGIISGQRLFHNYQEGQLDPEHLRLTQETQRWLDDLERDQPGDFLVFPFQFGLRHRGRSVRRAVAVFTPDEVGLGPYEVVALLVTQFRPDYRVEPVACHRLRRMRVRSRGRRRFPCLPPHVLV